MTFLSRFFPTIFSFQKNVRIVPHCPKTRGYIKNEKINKILDSFTHAFMDKVAYILTKVIYLFSSEKNKLVPLRLCDRIDEKSKGRHSCNKEIKKVFYSSPFHRVQKFSNPFLLYKLSLMMPCHKEVLLYIFHSSLHIYFIIG